MRTDPVTDRMMSELSLLKLIQPAYRLLMSQLSLLQGTQRVYRLVKLIHLFFIYRRYLI